jgi:hypothetical protein
VIARRCTKAHFLHGLCVSLCNCVWITGAHVAFFDTYVVRHASEAQMMSSMPFGGRVMMLLTGPVIGVVSGLILGLFAFIASRFVKPQTA